MKDLPRIDTLCRIRLRHSFAPIVGELGPADETSLSPPHPAGSVFANYLWERLAPAISVLTWRNESGEYVWGVRTFGVGAVDPELGFGLGSPRSAVDARYLGVGESEGDVLRIPLEDGSLTVTFAGNVVREIQLLAPMDPEG
jgi:hypothetical protein